MTRAVPPARAASPSCCSLGATRGSHRQGPRCSLSLFLPAAFRCTPKPQTLPLFSTGRRFITKAAPVGRARFLAVQTHRAGACRPQPHLQLPRVRPAPREPLAHTWPVCWRAVHPGQVWPCRCEPGPWAAAKPPVPGQERRSQEVIGLTEIWGALISLSLQQEFLIPRYFYKRFQLSELQPSWLCPLRDRANNHPRAAWSSSWTSPGLCFHISNLQPTGRLGRGAGQPQGPAQAPSLAAGLSPHAEVTPREELGARGR